MLIPTETPRPREVASQAVRIGSVLRAGLSGKAWGTVVPGRMAWRGGEGTSSSGAWGEPGQG